MIQLVRPETSTFADEIETTFQSWVLAYRCRIVDENRDDQPGAVDAPVVLDGNRRIEGKEAIRRWMRELERELDVQRSVSGDGCYIDPESGDVC